jgi:thiol-disulfide isomerase/thioredoxin
MRPHRARFVVGWPGALAFVFALALAAPAWAGGVAKGDRAAEFTGVKDRAGKPLSLRALRGKVVVLTFGASWCKPCGKELPAYDKLAAKYKSDDRVAFVAINIDSERANADKFLADAGVKSLTVGFDPASKTVEKYQPGTMPTTYVIDGNGIVREVHAGYEKGDEAKIARAVDQLRAK